jgi:2,3-bisphosphoglycerate-dependent phosphoglycerate mutase
MHLYVIRHGESHINLNEWMPAEGQSMDASLTDLGKTQAEALAAWMPGAVPHLDAIFASTMLRARETVAPLSLAYSLPVTFDDFLREIGNSMIDHSPIPVDMLPRTAAYDKKDEDPFLPMVKDLIGVETFMHFRSRIGMFLTRLARENQGKYVAVVCHGGVVNGIFDHAFNIGPYRRADVWVPNTGITYFEYLYEPFMEPWRLHYACRTEHLNLRR